MSIAQSLMPEFDQEMAGARKVLERVPEDKLEWKPDPKSMSMGRLAQHVAELAGWGKETMTKTELDLDPEGKGFKPPPPPTSRQELLDLLDKNVAASRPVIAGASDSDFMTPWSLLITKRVMMTMPRIAVMRNFVMNHMIHHRAQLTVYLRLTGVPVPGLYGPSADEKQMGAGM